MQYGHASQEDHGSQYTARWEGARPWGGLRPDEELERKEEMEDSGGMMERAWIQEDLLVYLFADGYADRWQDVALRALAVMRRYCPALLVGRRFYELDGLKQRGALQASFPLERFDEITACEERGVLLSGLLGYLFPGGGRWLKKGTMRVYLLARTFQPLLLRSHGSDPGYERLEEIFEGRKLTTRKERDRARSRWSARAQKLIRHPVEANGGRIAMQFGKSATARERYAAAAMGNENRKKGKS
jgi:hypothetical protein